MTHRNLEAVSFLVFLALVACSASRRDYRMGLLCSECRPNPDYAACSIDILNRTHANSDIIIRRTVSDLRMQFSVTQISNFSKTKIKRTLILRRQYEFCNQDLFGMTDYTSLYIIYTINAFFNGSQLSCPLTPRNLSIQSFTLTSNLIPFNLFYKPNSYIVVNGTFFEMDRGSKISLGHFLLYLKIEKFRVKYEIG
ncbi:uncharacterized protein LOC119660075 [Hermetia illucens]|uniref:uncharacterized protein LOC119660075 n=1 Tax=Hermetia illucens TaxID=343691 RepID=UPI0018CC5950|nr:uncharacterized protein LOC119660075 [Hermetia illucens]